MVSRNSSEPSTALPRSDQHVVWGQVPQAKTGFAAPGLKQKKAKHFEEKKCRKT